MHTRERPSTPVIAPKRILIVRPSALGDVCRTVPVLVSLKRTFPGAEIDWLVQDAFAAAIAEHPDLSRAVLFRRRRFGAWGTPAVMGEVWAFLRSLRAARYDLVLDCQGLARSGLFTRATGAPVRIGFANAAEFGWVGLTRRVHAPRSTHTVDRMLLLAEAAGCEAVRDMRLYAADADRVRLGLKFDPAVGPYAVVAPTTRWAGKLWPAERYRVLVERLLNERSLGVGRVLVVGSDSERSQCAPLLEAASQDARVVDLIGQTDVGELLALIEGARLVVGSDSAAVHIAVGFARPLVGLYGPTRVDLVGPYGRSADVVQRVLPGDRLDHKDELAGRKIMTRISVEEVLKAAAAQLARPASTTTPTPAAV